VLAKLEALEAAEASRTAEAAVTLALKAGKITPAQKPWAESYALSDPSGFADFVAQAPQVVPIGKFDFGSDTQALKADAGLDEATRQVSQQMGISAETISKYGKE